MQNNPLKVFVVYAHEDKPVRDKLLRQLRPLSDNGDIDLWSDHEIKPGEAWDEAIRTRLEQSNLILLLVSDDFFASDYVRNVELREALARHSRGETRLLPIIARHCGWGDFPALARLQVLPPEGRPVISKEWDSPDEPYLKIYEGVKTVVRELRRKTPAQQIPPETTPESSPKNVRNWKPVAFVSIFALVAVAGVLWGIMQIPGGVQVTDNQLGHQIPDTASLGKPKNDTAQSEQLKSNPELKKSEAAGASDKDVLSKTKPPAKTTTDKPMSSQIQKLQPSPEFKLEKAKPQFDRQLPAVEGMSRVIKDREQGFLNTATGQVIGWYDDAENFNNGRAYVKQNNRYFWIDKTGRCVENCQ
ncbi:MAG: hypothetical protein OHK0019_08420 [Saprospiraceae bacterium]